MLVNRLCSLDWEIVYGYLLGVNTEAVANEMYLSMLLTPPTPSHSQRKPDFLCYKCSSQVTGKGAVKSNIFNQ